MDVMSIYERVNLSCAVSQKVFVDYYNDAVKYLISKYRPVYVISDGSGEHYKISDISDDSTVRDIYEQTIIDYIIYSVTGNENKRLDYMQNAQNSYESVWADFARAANIGRRTCRRCGGGW